MAPPTDSSASDMSADEQASDAAALRDRVDALEQTVSEQEATIDALSSPPVSRRGVLAALTGVAGAGALGAYSQRGAAQAAGQVGTQSEPVDVEAWSLNVQDQLAGDLDAGGNNLTNVGAVTTATITDADDDTTYDVGDDLAGGGGVSAGDHTNETASRSFDTEYQNTTGNPLIVHVTASTPSDCSFFELKLSAGGTSGSLSEVRRYKVRGDGTNFFRVGNWLSVMAIIPDGNYYSASEREMNMEIWVEQTLTLS